MGDPGTYPGVRPACASILGGGVDDVGVAVEELAVAVARDGHQLKFLFRKEVDLNSNELKRKF